MSPSSLWSSSLSFLQFLLSSNASLDILFNNLMGRSRPPAFSSVRSQTLLSEIPVCTGNRSRTPAPFHGYQIYFHFLLLPPRSLFPSFSSKLQASLFLLFLPLFFSSFLRNPKVSSRQVRKVPRSNFILFFLWIGVPKVLRCNHHSPMKKKRKKKIEKPKARWWPGARPSRAPTPSHPCQYGIARGTQWASIRRAGMARLAPLLQLARNLAYSKYEKTRVFDGQA